MTAAELDALLDHLLPVLITAGDFARAVQSGVALPDQKAGKDRWAQALTDADLAVQGFVEVAVKAHDASLGFVGEEWERSPTHKYFDPDAETVVCLDPINGTLLYQAQMDTWDMVLSVVHRGRLIAAVSYTPGRGVFHIGLRDRGARIGDRTAPRVAAMAPLKTRVDRRVCVTYQAPAALAAAKGAFEAYDMVADYGAAQVLDNLNDFFTGRLAAFACTTVELLDLGAQGFIVQAAGGVVTRLDGSPVTAFEAFEPMKQTDLLMAASPALHAELLGLMAAGSRSADT